MPLCEGFNSEITGLRARSASLTGRRSRRTIKRNQWGTTMQAIRFMIAAVLCATAIPTFAESSDIDLKAADGIRLKATYMTPGKPGPAMLLVHQCNMDRKMWGGIAAQLVDAGVHVLAIDLRGFGDSEGEGMRGSGGFGGFLQKSSGDVDLAYDYLVGQQGVDASTVAIGGASCGAMLTAELAARRDGVKALMLLSGPPSDNAVANMASDSDLAVFAAATTSDPITPGVADKLQGAVDGSPHDASIAKIYAGTEHGLPMFAQNADLEPALIDWLTAQLLD
jgi:dienelactone hydrolase